MGQFCFVLWLAIVVGIPLLLGSIGYLRATSLGIEPARRVIPYAFAGAVLSALFVVCSLLLLAIGTGGA